MFNKIKNLYKENPYKKRIRDIEPDEIFIDSENLPNFDTDQFEGRLEKSINTKTIVVFSLFCLLIFILFFFRSFDLQVVNGEKYFEISENNRLKETVIFTKRGVITDRYDNKLAWNIADEASPEFSLRKYSSLKGMSLLLGYIKYPSKDKYGFYYSEDYIGKDGIEKFYNDELTGQNGSRLIEIDARGKKQSESIVRQPEDGKDLKLSIDSELQSHIYKTINSLADQVGFTGGAGIIMDVKTGEVLAMTSYPEYNSQILTDGSDTQAINSYLKNKGNPFLDRVIDGLYTPGSIVKPFMSVAVLAEKIIDPNTKILSTGSISIPNPYDPEHPTVFKDWRAQGWVDMRHAIAVSSDVYFYEVGGGYENQKGLGIALIDKYMNEFGFGKDLPDGYFKSQAGTIPTPEWKKENFNGEEWRIGNTYHTSIGQYGFQVTPVQVVRAVASLANGGKLLEPSVFYGGNSEKYIDLNLNQDELKIVREGMKMSVEEGVASGLSNSFVKLGAKTGTAELGVKKDYVNSWVTGFFPYDNPKYAFAILMEKGPVKNTVGGVYVMRQVLEWINVNRSEYFD